MQAVFSAALWRPVDQEVEDLLAQETSVRRTAQEEVQEGAVHPPCGYGLLQAKQEARKVRALSSLMKVRGNYRCAIFNSSCFPNLCLNVLNMHASSS